MPIGTVYLHSDTYLACLNHALSTEKEEIMGLLLGHVNDQESPSKSYIESVVILQRSDRKADRCEISPEQLIDATKEAERLSNELGRNIRVIGWYHSHPHITVWPSHVGTTVRESVKMVHLCKFQFIFKDLRTQMDYQGMDSDFIGLIFSVFREQNNEKFSGISMICFQTIEEKGQLASKEIQIQITPQIKANYYCLKALTEIPRALCNEDEEMYRNAQANGTDIVTKIHNKAVFSQMLCELVESCEVPCISALSAYQKSLECKLRELKRRKEDLGKLVEI